MSSETILIGLSIFRWGSERSESVHGTVVLGSLLLIKGMHKWRPKMYSFVSVLIRLTSLTLKKHLFNILSMQTRLEKVRPPFMHSVNDRESERTKISLRGDISLQVRHIPLPLFNDLMIPTNSGQIVENLGRTWGEGEGVFRGFDRTP